jgi:hypothetical protein
LEGPAPILKGEKPAHLPVMQLTKLKNGECDVPTSQKYQQRATECLRLANLANDPSNRRLLLELGQAWSRLAEQPTAKAEDQNREYRRMNKGSNGDHTNGTASPSSVKIAPTSLGCTDRKLDDTCADTPTIMAKLRNQNAEFCRRLRIAIERGDERRPTSVNTLPGPKNLRRASTGPAGPAADQVRVGGQPQHRERAWT